ncbi:MAG: hypothetical protein KDF60_15575, partial [Calditrichaeota bacterium]|nr:hypothetical protein [Calditrichota bacterium]
MRIIFLFFIILISYSNTQLIDEIFFGIITDETNANYAVIQTADGGYAFAGIYKNNQFDETRLVKTDAHGKTLWVKSFPGKTKSALYNRINMHETPDSGYIFITIGPASNDSTSVIAVKTDKNGNTQWLKTFSSLNDVSVGGLIPTLDGGALLTYDRFLDSVLVVKLTKNGSVQWKHSYPYKTSFKMFEAALIQNPDSSYLFSRLGLTVAMDPDGTEQWRADKTSYSFFSRLSNGNLVYFKYPTYDATLNSQISYTLTDSMGNFIENNIIDLESNGYLQVNNLIKTKDGGMLFCGNRFLLIDEEFNVQWIKNANEDYPFFLYSTAETVTGSFIFAGFTYWQNAEKGILIKTDNLGDSHYIIMRDPQDEALIPRNSDYRITWISDGVESVNIEYREENASEWQTLVENYSSDSGAFSWNTPGNYNDKGRIRIIDSSNPDVFDQNENPFSIISKAYDYINTNNCLMWFSNKGEGSHNPNTDGNGFYWPEGLNSYKSSIFMDGLLWGGKIDNNVRVNGDTYRAGLNPGNILQDGTAADPNDPRFGIWRVKSGWETLPDGTEKDRLKVDWENWPVDLGAPWKDNDADGVYDPAVDNPEISGDETFWMVMNDLDTTTSRFTYGADPIGLEIKLQVYAYNRDDDLADVVFKKYQVYNKGNNRVDSMFFSYWSDPDLGTAHDDYSGCDTVLDMAYCWNDGEDEYYGPQTPAVGYVLLQGPKVVATAQDSAFAFNRWQYGYKNEDMYAFTLYIGASNVFVDPSLGVINGSQMFYNNFTGRVWNGNPIIDPRTNETTRFAIPGDPVNGNGWYEGKGWPGGPESNDRRMVMSSGPFDFAPGDSQEV